MNKTYLIVVGTCAASLAAGSAGGYFFAKKKYLGQLEETVDREVAAAKKLYSLQAMDVKPPLEAIVSAYDDIVEENEPLPLEAEEELSKPATEALVNYQGFIKTAPKDEVIESNIFSNSSPKKLMPPREPGTGKFVSKDKPVEIVKDKPEPFPISEDDFLANLPEHQQESVLFFVHDDTAVMEADYNEVVDAGRIGQFQLEKLKTSDNNVIYIRNDGLQEDYQVTRTTDSLTEAMGLGESESDIDEIDAAEHRTAREDESAYQ